jgi:hypothetical protein
LAQSRSNKLPANHKLVAVSNHESSRDGGRMSASMMNRQTERQADRQMHIGHRSRILYHKKAYTKNARMSIMCKTELHIPCLQRWTDGTAEGWTDRQTDRETDRQTDSQIDR